MPLYLVHYSSEVGLKGQNRGAFIRQLQRNIRAQLPVTKVQFWQGRLLVESPHEDLDFSRVFGVAWWTRPHVVEPATPEALHAAVQSMARALQDRYTQPPTFAVRARRVDKRFPLNTLQLERELGAAVVQAVGWKVDLTTPQVTFYVDVLPGRAFLYIEKHPGHHGLPVGVSGRAFGLYSGGIDSIMAAWYMARRGVEVELVHFHAFTEARHAHEGRAGKLAQHLARYLPRLRVHYLPYHHFMAATLDLQGREQRYELVLFRRFMARIAEHLARQEGGQAIFTGDSLGQVASQTMENLAAVDEAVSLPFFRPLLAFNKQEIIDQGERLGFYALVLEPYKDCCSIVSRNPATRSRLERIRDLEARLPLQEAMARTLEEREVYEYRVVSGQGSVESDQRPVVEWTVVRQGEGG